MAERLHEKAVELVSDEGPEALTLRALADKADVFFTAPQYHFGSVAGLLAAVAASGFSELRQELGRERLKSPAGSKYVAVALAHARFGLERSNLYKGMHDPRFWRLEHEAASENIAKVREHKWIQEARRERNGAFDEYQEAVVTDQDHGTLNRNRLPVHVAHFLTTLVDGYLFQATHEQVHGEKTDREHLAYLKKHLLEMAGSGIRTGEGVAKQ
jgi:AcrR family transcriptional regulator